MKAASFFLSVLLLANLGAQAPGVAIFDQSPEGLNREGRKLGKQASEIFEKNIGVTLEAVAAKMKEPTQTKFTLAEPERRFLTAAQIAEKAEQSSYRVGWAYLCHKCDNWHVNLAGGYAISDDGLLATCAHVVEPDRKLMKKGLLIAVDKEGKVHPITDILRYHRQMDAAVVKIEAETVPLAMSDRVHPGDPAFCLSRPLKQGEYFSKGIVNRFFWSGGSKVKDEASIKKLAYLKMNVSSRWAPGSSGSAVLDQCGNVIGHVAQIKTHKGGNENSILLTTHSGTPARSIMALCQSTQAVSDARDEAQPKKAEKKVTPETD